MMSRIAVNAATIAKIQYATAAIASPARDPCTATTFSSIHGLMMPTAMAAVIIVPRVTDVQVVHATLILWAAIPL